jgi:hypothetical protein
MIMSRGNARIMHARRTYDQPHQCCGQETLANLHEIRQRAITPAQMHFFGSSREKNAGRVVVRQAKVRLHVCFRMLPYADILLTI